MLAHIFIALGLQTAVASFSRSWWAGAAAAAAWAISREITQAEYRWIEQFGSGLRVKMPWWGGLAPSVWHLDAMLDWMLPCAFVVALAAFMQRSREKRG